ncbi:PAAR domain-containing protein, partial [Photorhabdus namnaonensis]
QCKGVFPIIQGADSLTYKGKAIALEGMQTACGAKLIASQHEFTLAS